MTQASSTSSPNSDAVRQNPITELRLDLIGPDKHHPDLEREILPRRPSQWYLGGYLVPIAADEEQRAVDADEEMDEGLSQGGGDDDHTPEKESARRHILPSSMGVSVLVESA